MPYNPEPVNYTDPRFKAYRDALAALAPINTNEKADEYRRIWEEFHNQKLCPIVFDPPWKKRK